MFFTVSVSPASSYSSELDRHTQQPSFAPYGPAVVCRSPFDLSSRSYSTPPDRRNHGNQSMGWYDSSDVMHMNWSCSDVNGNTRMQHNYQLPQPGNNDMYSVEYGWNTAIDLKPIISSGGLSAYPGKTLFHCGSVIHQTLI